MAKEFFKNFPEMQYKLDDGKIITIKDFFRKSNIEGAAREAVVNYTLHELQEGDRPDVLASKLYGNGDLHWTFFLVNDFDNYYDWWKDQITFENYINHKYKGKYFVCDSVSDIVSSTSKFLLGESITGTNSRGTSGWGRTWVCFHSGRGSPGERGLGGSFDTCSRCVTPARGLRKGGWGRLPRHPWATPCQTPSE